MKQCKKLTEKERSTLKAHEPVRRIGLIELNSGDLMFVSSYATDSNGYVRGRFTINGIILVNLENAPEFKTKNIDKVNRDIDGVRLLANQLYELAENYEDQYNRIAEEIFKKKDKK